MIVSAYPSEWNEDEGLQPVYVQDITLFASPEELRRLAAELVAAASELEKSGATSTSVQFGDSKPNAKTPIWFYIEAGK